MGTDTFAPKFYSLVQNNSGQNFGDGAEFRYVWTLFKHKDAFSVWEVTVYKHWVSFVPIVVEPCFYGQYPAFLPEKCDLKNKQVFIEHGTRLFHLERVATAEIRDHEMEP